MGRRFFLLGGWRMGRGFKFFFFFLGRCGMGRGFFFFRGMEGG